MSKKTKTQPTYKILPISLGIFAKRKEGTDPANEKECKKNVKKLIKHVACGDEQYCEWINRKARQNYKNEAGCTFTFLIETKKTKERVVGALFAKDKKVNFLEVPVPVMCEDETVSALPEIWRNKGEQKLNVISLIKKDTYTPGDGRYTTPNAKKNFKKIHLILKKAKFLKQTATAPDDTLLSKILETEIVQTYRRQEYYDMKNDLTRLDYKYVAKEIDQELLICLSGVYLNMLPVFDYIKCGKDVEATRNLLTFPYIEKFYGQNPHLVTNEVRTKLRAMSNCYETVLNNTGLLFMTKPVVSTTP